MAELDPLTGVANRRGFDLALERAAATGEPYALILVDLDDFKRVNDEQGHPAGDAVLQSVAVAAADVARQGDCLARIGGDEFALIAPGAGAAGVLRLLRDLRDVGRARGHLRGGRGARGRRHPGRARGMRRRPAARAEARGQERARTTRLAVGKRRC